MKNQILCKCTAGVYETELIRTREGTARKKNISRSINTNYTILSYGALASSIKDLSDQDIVNKYSGCFYVVDEAHNLVNSGIDHRNETNSIYYQLHRFFHVIKRSKIAVCSATPMINDVKEIVPIMNLVLPLDNQMPYNVDYRYVTLSQVEPYFRGKITFVRALDTGVRVENRGIPLFDKTPGHPLVYTIDVPRDKNLATPLHDGMNPPLTVQKTIASQIKVWAKYMEPFQEKIYDKTTDKSQVIDLAELDNPTTDKNAVHHNEFFSSCFVFPDGSFGGQVSKNREPEESGLGKYIYSPGNDIYEFRDPPDFMFWPERGHHTTFESWIYNNGNLDNLRKLSCKFAAILELEINQPGCSFIYSEFIVGGTAIMLCMCFKAFGYEFYNDTISAFVTNKNDESVCIEGKRTLRTNFVPKRRIFFLNPAAKTKIDSALELFSSRENKDGQYISKVIGSRISRDGINLYNCLRFHALLPSWHPAGRKQSENRIFRSVSHDYLIEAERERLGNPNADIAIQVDIYYHVALSHSQLSIDVWGYRYGEEKDFYISQMMRYAKQCAVDCRTNYERNVRPTDVDGSARCDYDVCQYTCVTADKLPDENEVDYSTYDILYTDEATESCIDEICKLLHIRGSISYIEIINIFSDIYRERVIYLSISAIIERKIKIVNRFGFDCFVVSDGLILFTQLEYPSGNTADYNNTIKDVSIYGQDLVSIETKTFSQNKTIQQEPYQKTLLDKLISIANPGIEPGYSAAINIINSMIFETKLKLIEDSIIDIVTNGNNSSILSNTVKYYFSSYIFYTYEPINDINTYKKLYLVNSKDEPALSKDKQSDNIVYLHTFESSNIEATTYSEISRFMKNTDIKIYNPQEILGWRDVLPYELPAYSAIITNLNDLKSAPYEQYPWYGIILNGRFLIRNKSEETDTTNKSARRRGRECSSTPVLELLTYAVSANINLEEFKHMTTVPLDRNTNIAYFISKALYTMEYLSKLTDSQLILLRKWEMYNSGPAKTGKICYELKNWLINNNRMLTI